MAKTESSKTLERRIFLRGSVATAALGLLPSLAQGATTSDLRHVPVLNLLTTLESLSFTLFDQVLTAGSFGLNDSATQELRAVVAAEQSHLQQLAALGGHSLTRQFALPDHILYDAGTFADTALHLKQSALSAYIAAAQDFAKQNRPELSAVAAQLAASEAQQQVVISKLAGFSANLQATPVASFRQVSDLLPTLLPFLKPSKGCLLVSLPV